MHCSAVQAGGMPTQLSITKSVLLPWPIKTTTRHTCSAGTGWTYTVALSDCIVDAGEETLAPDFNPGDAVLYTKADGGQVEACISGMDLSCW